MQRFLTGYTRELTDIVNGNLEFGLNIKSQMITSEFPQLVEVGIQHSLGRLPLGFITIANNTNCVLFSGPSFNTVNTIFIKAGSICTATILVI